MPLRWVQNTTNQISFVNGEQLLPGEGIFVDDGPLPQPAPDLNLNVAEVAGIRSLVSGDVIQAPPSNVTAAVGAAGVLTGAYYYATTFVTSAGETAPWPGSATVVNPSSQQVNLTTIPLGPAGVIARRVYRTPAVTGLIDPKDYRFVVEIPDNTTTTYTDNLGDGSLGGPVSWNATNRGGFRDSAGVEFAKFSDQSTALGQSTFNTNTGYASTAVGFEALKVNTTGRRNTALGVYSLTSLTTGFENTAAGVHSGQNVAAGIGNVFFGYAAGFYGSGTCQFNTGLGSGALSGTAGLGIGNTAVGYRALGNINTANNCLGLGFFAGRYADNVRQIFIDVLDRTNNTNSKDVGWAYGEADSVAINQRARMNSLVRVGPPGITVATLPAAAAALAGFRGYVTDANATTFASVVAGGGSNVVPVYCDGAAWRIG